MSDEIKTNSEPKKGFPIWRTLISIALLLAISSFILRIYVNVMLLPPPELYAKTFVSWRTNAADSILFSTFYTGLKQNELPISKKLTEFIKTAQTEDGLLVAGKFPIHAPRGLNNIHTLYGDDEKPIVELLWQLESRIRYLIHDQVENFSKAGYKNFMKQFTNTSNVKNDKDNFFVMLPSKTISDEAVADAFKDVGCPNNELIKAANTFVTICKNINKREDSYMCNDKGEVSDDLLKDIKQFATDIGYSKVDNITKEKVNEYLKNMGTINASPLETFLYSRLFNLFTFLTINHKFNFTDEEKKTLATPYSSSNKTTGNDADKDNKLFAAKKNILKKYSMMRANAFAQLFAKVYKHEFKADPPQSVKRNFIIEYYIVKPDISKAGDYDGLNKELIKEAEGVVRQMTGSSP